MKKQITCEVRTAIGGRVLAVSSCIVAVDLDAIRPLPSDTMEHGADLHRAERRKRYIDNLAALMAYELTEALFDAR
ncbi:hypothetical protein KQX64_06990 [Rhodopseudomonas palustris]|nr:hypothetical protein KQX64_06990 [Rhodopseudomonas palustris]